MYSDRGCNGYKVAASNPGSDIHPFLRSWIAEMSWLLEICNGALGSPCLGHRQSALACLRHKFPQVASQLRYSVVSEHQAMLGADFCAIFGYPVTEVMP